MKLRARHIFSCILGLAAGVPAAAQDTGGSLASLIASAKPGDTVALPPGRYDGVVRIDKPIHLVAQDEQNRPVIDGRGSGDIIEILVPGVEIRGLRIQGTGIDLDKENCGIRVLAGHATIVDNILEDVLFGIDLKEAPDCTIRGNTIGGKKLDVARRGDGLRLWRSDRTVIENNTIHNGRDAILWYSAGVVVRGNRVHHSRYGFHLMYSNQVTLESNELTDNSVGVYFMYSQGLTLRQNQLLRNRGPSGYGIGLKDVDDYHIERNIISGNCVGVYIDDSPFTKKSPGVFTLNTIACNDAGMQFLPSARGNVVHENAFIDNLEQVAVQGRGELKDNEFDLNERGNFWSDYAGYDSDGDGVGEAEYASSKLFESLLDREPRLRLMLHSPAQQAVEFVARAIPAIRPEPKLTDWYPLLAPPSGLYVPVRSAEESRGLMRVAGALLGVSALIGVIATGVPAMRLSRSKRMVGLAPGGVA